MKLSVLLILAIVAAGVVTDAQQPTFFSQPSTTSASWTSATASNTASTVTVSGYTKVVVTLHATSTMTGGVLTFEADDGSGTWWALPLTQSAGSSTGTTQSTFTLSVVDQAWEANIGAWAQFRVRLSTVITGSGTATVAITRSAAASARTSSGGAGTPAGSSGDVQTNGGGGSFGASSNLHWTGSTLQLLSAAGLTASGTIDSTNNSATTGAFQVSWFRNNETGVPDFGCVQSLQAGSNGATRRDNLLNCGYNVGTGGKQVSTEHTFSFGTESDYTTAESIRQLEWWASFTNAGGTRSFRPMSLTIKLATADSTFATDTASVSFRSESDTEYANFTPTGVTFATPNLYFNSALHTIQINTIATAGRTITIPDVSGSLVLYDGSSLTTLPGGLKLGSSGTDAFKLYLGSARATAGTGATAEFTGDFLQIKGVAGLDTVLMVTPSAASTYALQKWTNSGNTTLANVTNGGKGIFNGLGIGPAGEFDNYLTLSATVTANRTITFPDTSGTVALTGISQVVNIGTVTLTFTGGVLASCTNNGSTC